MARTLLSALRYRPARVPRPSSAWAGFFFVWRGHSCPSDLVPYPLPGQTEEYAPPQANLEQLLALPRWPAPRIAPAVEAGYHYNPMILHFEEDAIGKATNSRTTTAAVDSGKLQCMFRDCVNRGLDRQRETFPKFRANVVIPSPGFLQVLVRFWYPDDRKCHGFLNRSALTFCHEMTSAGSCSCRAMR